MTKLRILRGETYPGSSRWALSAITSILIREIRQRGEGNEKQAERIRRDCCLEPQFLRLSASEHLQVVWSGG